MDWFNDGARRAPSPSGSSRAQTPEAEVVDVVPATRWAEQFVRTRAADSPLGPAPPRRRQRTEPEADVGSPLPLHDLHDLHDPATGASATGLPPAMALEPWLLEALAAPLDTWPDSPPPSPGHERSRSLSPFDPSLFEAIAEDLSTPAVQRPTAASSGLLGRTTPTPALAALGYGRTPMPPMSDHAQAALLEHHAALCAKGFSHEQLAAISARPQSLAWLAENLDAIYSQLPGLDLALTAGIAGSAAGGPPALTALLRVAGPLKGQPLRLTDEQLGRIALGGGGAALDALCLMRQVVVEPPFNFTPEQATAIASQGSGGTTLKALWHIIDQLRDYDGPQLTTDQIVALSARKHGRAVLKAVLQTMAPLRQQGLSSDQVIDIARTCVTGEALRTIAALEPRLTGPSGMGLTPEQVTDLARSQGGHHTLQAVHDMLPALRQAGLTNDQVVAIAVRHRNALTRPALETTLASMEPLGALGIPADRVAAIASASAGSRALAALISTMPVLQALGLDVGQAVDLALARNGRPALFMLEATVKQCSPLPVSLDLKTLLALGKSHGLVQPIKAVNALAEAVHKAMMRP
jgi:hypothetical protein